MDFEQPTLGNQPFDALMCMGNTVGINQSPRTLAPFLAGLRNLIGAEGRFVLSGVDPLSTTVPNRIEYHALNISRGLPPALVSTKLEYRGESSDWWDLWIPTEEEFATAATQGGWTIETVEREGAARLWILRAVG